MSREAAGAALRALRESRDFSLADLAAVTGVSSMGLSYLGGEPANPTKAQFRRLKNGLGLPLGPMRNCFVADDAAAELAQLLAGVPDLPTDPRDRRAVVVSRHTDADVLEAHAEAHLESLNSLIARLPAETSNEYETYIQSVVAQCVKAEMLAANSWRVAVNAGSDSAGRLMAHLKTLEASGPACWRMPGSIGARFDRACHCSGLPDAVIAALLGVTAEEMWAIRNRGWSHRGAAPGAGVRRGGVVIADLEVLRRAHALFAGAPGQPRTPPRCRWPAIRCAARDRRMMPIGWRSPTAGCRRVPPMTWTFS